MINPYIDTLIVIFIYMTLWYFIAMIKNDNSIIDIAWGLGFVVVAWYQNIFYTHENSLVLTIMVSLWGIRLGIYLFLRNWHEGEDWRYQKMRKNWKANFYVTSYFRIFMLQGVLMFIIALIIAQQPMENPSYLQPLKYVGIIIFAIGFLWESIADYQLQKFKAHSDNKGQFMTKGLWKYSRHPNYFGEILVWWGIYIFTIPYGCWCIFIISPIFITFLLNRVSGVPFLERKQKKNPLHKQYYLQVPNAIIPKFW